MALHNLISNMGKMERYNPYAHMDEENVSWCWERAIEWINWPLYLSPTVLPGLLLMWPWPQAVFTVLFVNWGWYLFVGREGAFVSRVFSDLGEYFISLKWIVCPVLAGYFFYHLRFIECLITLVWPFIPFLIHVPVINKVILIIAPAAPIRPVQEELMLAMGYPPGIVKSRKIRPQH